jgi:hypothetical protein
MFESGLMPWDMRRLTPAEERGIVERRQQLEQQAAKEVTPAWQRAR